MLISRLLAAEEFTPEQRHVIELAFNHALSKLSLVNRDDPISEIVAREVIEVAAGGASNAVAIAETVYRRIGLDK